MWIVRWIIAALVIIVVLGFAIQNQEATASVSFWTWTTPELPLYLMLYISFVLGIVFWLAISIVKMMQQKNACHKLQKEIKRLKNELDRLRNAHIDEDIPEKISPENIYAPKNSPNPDAAEEI